MKGVQCYELFGGIALKNHTCSFFFYMTRVKQILKYILYLSMATTLRQKESSCGCLDVGGKKKITGQYLIIIIIIMVIFRCYFF